VISSLVFTGVTGHAFAAEAPDYDSIYKTYAEACYATKVSFKVGIPSTDFGHAMIFLKGACRDRNAGFPTLKTCNPDIPGNDGVGVSADNSFANVNRL
jgi:hypothetical protein